MPVLEIRQEYGYVLLTATSTCFLNLWHGMRVGYYRREADVKYPNAYACQSDIETTSSEEKRKALYLFNCAQRAHYNYLENYPPFLACMLIRGLKYPIAVSVAGVIWMGFRALYAIGYTRADKPNGSGRYIGPFFAAQGALHILAGLTGWRVLNGGKSN